jgi:hypothetical protein
MIHIVEMFFFAISKNSKASKHFYENRERRNVKMKSLIKNSARLHEP